MNRLILSIILSLLMLSSASTILRAGDLEEESERNAPKDRMDWFYMQRSYPNGIPAGARLKALRQLQSMSAAKKRDEMNRTSATIWQQTGPSNVGGRITAIAYDPNTPALFIGAAEGGVWRGVPGSGSAWTWTPCTDKSDALAMGALALDPTDGKIVYAGTGEWANSWSGFFGTGSPQYAGSGMLKSTDAGATWKNVGLTNVAAFSRIIINPDNSKIVWAATNRGLYRTSNGGTTWIALVPDSACSDVQLDPNDHTRLYVAISGAGVFGIPDADSSSSSQLRRLSASFPAQDTTLGRISLSASVSGGTTIVYAVVADQKGGYKGIFKLTGFAWSTLPVPSSLFSNNQGWYDITIAANPSDASKVIVGGVPLYISNNGGSTWTYNSGVHPDQHLVYFDPSGVGTVFLGNDGGIYYSDNNGASFSDISDGLAITQFYGIDIDPAAQGKIAGGSQDNGSWLGTGAAWSGLSGGDGGMTRMDAANSAVYVEALAGGAGGGQGTVAKILTNGGGTSVVFQNSDHPGDRHPWVRPIAIDKSNGSIYIGSNRVYRSPVGGGAFSAISGDLTRNNNDGARNTISAIGLTPGSPATIWTGSNDGLAFVTIDGGASWTNISNGLPGRAVTRIYPTSPSVAYLTTSGFGPAHVLKTVNGGAAWTDITSNLPDIPVNTIVIDPDHPTHLFVGTDIGVLYSVDDGGSWVPYMDGLPNVVVNDLIIQTGTKLLFAGTYGRSSWSAPMNATVVALGSPVYGPLWFTNQTYPIVWYGVSSAKISVSTDDGVTWTTIDNAQNGPTYQWTIPSGINTTTARVKVENSSSTLISDAFTIRAPRKGDVLATVSRPFVPYGLSFDGHNLWTTSFYERKVYKLDPDFLTVRDTIPSPNRLDSCTGIVYASDLKLLFVHRLNHDAQGRPLNKIYAMDTNGVVKKTFTSPAVYPTGLAYDGTSLYAVDRDSAKIYLLDPSSGSVEGSYRDPVSKSLGPRGLTFIPNSTNQFLHVVTVFNPSLVNTWLYRMELGGTGFRATDTAALTTNGSLINARGIEKDTRYPNAYWVSDFGTGTSGSIYRIVGFDLQSLSVVSPSLGVIWKGDSLYNITWSHTLVDSVMLEISYDNGSHYLPIAGPLQTSDGFYRWKVPDTSSTRCKVRITATGTNGVSAASGTFTIQGKVSVLEKSTSPDGFILYQNFPNPFNPTTEILYSLPRNERVTLEIFNVDGQRVRTLEDGSLSAGMHRAALDAGTLPSGAYSYVLRAGATELSRTMILSK